MAIYNKYSRKIIVRNYILLRHRDRCCRRHRRRRHHNKDICTYRKPYIYAHLVRYDNDDLPYTQQAMMRIYQAKSTTVQKHHRSPPERSLLMMCTRNIATRRIYIHQHQSVHKSFYTSLYTLKCYYIKLTHSRTIKVCREVNMCQAQKGKPK